MRLLIVTVALLRVAYGQGATIPLSIQQARPLWEAAHLLEQKFGLAVGYEDLSYTNPGDLVDVVSPAYRLNHPNAKGLVPREGHLSFAIDPAMQSAGANGAAALAQQLVDQHHTNGNPGQFKVLRLLGDTIAIVPVADRDAKGTIVPVSSPLDTRISLPEIERDSEQALADLCQAVTNASGKTVRSSIPPAKGLTVTIGANNAVARDVLVGILSGLHWKDPRNVAKQPKLTWVLNYEPNLNVYLMQIHQVRHEHLIPTGKTVLSPVYR